MNKMQKKIQCLSAKLAILALVYVSLVSLTSCSDDDEPVKEVIYSWEFEELAPSTPDFMDDKYKIESTFKAALGASGTATSVTKQGSSETCDKEVLEACQRAFDSLKDEVWQGCYVFVVTNTTTDTPICKVSFNADHDNAWTDFSKSYTAYDLKIGDYYYSDGTWSDGGLRKFNPVNNKMEWAEQIPKPESGKTVIGIVFYTGFHDYDKSDYTESGIGQKNCHGYVIALTDVNNSADDCLRWGYGPKGDVDIRLGTYTISESWSGFNDQLIVQEYVSKNNGWEMKHFPAFLACATYGNRTLDQDGNPTNAYDWQQPLAAPKNSSGWFLPSYGQLKYIDKYCSFLEDHIKIIRDNTSNDSSYKKYINVFREDRYYWSSTEDAKYTSSALSLKVHVGLTPICKKRNAYNVRAVLAF